MAKTLTDLFLELRVSETKDRMEGLEVSGDTIRADKAFHKRVEEVLAKVPEEEHETTLRELWNNFIHTDCD